MIRENSVAETPHKDPGTCAGSLKETTCETAPCPPAFLEYTWYASLAYAILGQVWGVVIPSVGGAVLGLLAAACFLSLGAQALRVYAPAAFALCTGISSIAVAFFFHNAQSFENSLVFIGWLCNVVVAQALSLRPGFLHRFAMAAFAIGLGVLPYVGGMADAGFTRVAASGTGISNPNSLGMWFGFCTVYFLLWGVQTRSRSVRAVYWAAGLGCLLMVALTVSRGPLLGIVLACVVGLRSALKRNFAPLLSLVFLMWGLYAAGVFQEKIDLYTSRGTEESGRGNVWPAAIERASDSLWTGVGFDAIKTKIAWKTYITPHNALLYILLGAGIIPLMCFLRYLAQASIGALRIMRNNDAGEAALLPPLVTFALIETMTLDTAFMSAWVIMVFALAVVKRTPLPDR